jgi:hypothetical protein
VQATTWGCQPVAVQSTVPTEYVQHVCVRTNQVVHSVCLSVCRPHKPKQARPATMVPWYSYPGRELFALATSFLPRNTVVNTSTS